jgi:hypothetical protein
MVSVPLTAGTPTRSARFSSDAWGGVRLGTIESTVFEMALAAVDCAVQSGSIEDPSTLMVIDYSRPSTVKRLWVFDLRERALLYEELVAHGKGSGDNLATRFSNEPDSNQSSLGLFLTQDAYMGKNGYSLRLRGLDEGFNDRAYDRAIVMHGAESRVLVCYSPTIRTRNGSRRRDTLAIVRPPGLPRAEPRHSSTALDHLSD